jgi:hypothetical protein
MRGIDEGYGIWDMGYGLWVMGYGKRERERWMEGGREGGGGVEVVVVVVIADSEPVPVLLAVGWSFTRSAR